MEEISITQYSKIFEYFKKQITSGQLQSGQKMPTEEEICNSFNTSRITTRRALEMLSNEGMIVKIQGKGSYVCEKKDSMQLNELLGFSSEMRRLGKVPSTDVIGVTLVGASKKVAEKLNIEVGKQVYEIKRIRYADGVKVAYEKVSIPFSAVPGITSFDLSGSLYKVLAEEYDIIPSWANETLEATLASQKIADILDVKVNSPVLAMERISCDKVGRLYELAESVYRGDKYRFTVTMK